VSEIVESPSAPEPGIAVEQQGPTRVVFRIYREVWEGAVEVGRIEVDIAKRLDPRISITVRRLDQRKMGREGFEPSTLGLRVPCSTS
jgi:hypothetical protein